MVLIPDNAGDSAYRWDEFLRAVLAGGNNPEVRFTIRLSDGIEPISTTCVAMADQYLASVRQRADNPLRSEPNLKLDCQRN